MRWVERVGKGMRQGEEEMEIERYVYTVGGRRERAPVCAYVYRAASASKVVETECQRILLYSIGSSVVEGLSL
jgi:hypothetical protein